MVLKIEQIPNGVKFTKYEISNEHEQPLVEVRTYTMNGKYTRIQKQHSKVKAGLKKRKLRIETVTDSSGISGDVVHGIRTKEAEEWELTPDLQMLTQKIRKDWQSIQIESDTGESCTDFGGCHVFDSIRNDRTTDTDQLVYTRRSLLSEALAEACRN